MPQEDPRSPDSLALEFMLLNALRIGLSNIEYEPGDKVHEDLADAIQDGDFSWREDDDGRFVFTLNGKEYVLHHLEI